VSQQIPLGQLRERHTPDATADKLICTVTDDRAAPPRRRRHDRTGVRVGGASISGSGPIATFWPSADHFRSSPPSRPAKRRLASLKGASFGLMHRSKPCRHSITSLAWVSSNCGTSRPSEKALTPSHPRTRVCLRRHGISFPPVLSPRRVTIVTKFFCRWHRAATRPLHLPPA
jgi:hypothetical protein